MIKRCSRCGIEKDEGEFYGNRKDCKECHKQVVKQWNIENSERNKTNQKLWRDRNPTYMSEYNRENEESVKRASKEWYTLNKQHVSEYKKAYRKANKDYVHNRDNKRHHFRKNSDPFYKFKCQIRNTLSVAIHNHGYSKHSKTASLLGCSYEALMEHLGPQPSPDHEIDHICPVAVATSEEELLKLQHYTTLRWLHRDDNRRKSDNWTPEGAAMCLQLLGRELVTPLSPTDWLAIISSSKFDHCL